MRALSYFTYDPSAAPGSPRDRSALTAAFEAYCVNGSHNNQGTVAEAVADEARPLWGDMVVRIKESRVGYLIVVPGADHLGGTLLEQVNRVLEADALSCQVVCDDQDFPDPLQNALRSKSSLRGERIREGMRAKAAQGLGLGKPPYGYRIGFDGAFSIVEPEAEVVRSIYEAYVGGGGGVRAIAVSLNERGLRTRRGRQWSMVTIRDILRNSAYIGTYRRFGLRIPGTYAPIVSDAVFRAAQEQMHSRTPVRRHPSGEPFLLAGLLYCGHCGSKMMGVTRRQSWHLKDGQRARGEYRYYQCQTRINRNLCEYRTTRADALETEVLRQVGALGLSPGDGPGAASPPADPAVGSRAVERRVLDLVKRTANGSMVMPQLRIAITEVMAGIPNGDSIEPASEPGAEAGSWDAISAAEQRIALNRVLQSVTLTNGEATALPR